MEDTLKLILSEIRELKEGQKVLTGKIENLETKFDNFDRREQEHFDFLIDEYGKVYNDLDKRISVLETK